MHLLCLHRKYFLICNACKIRTDCPDTYFAFASHFRSSNYFCKCNLLNNSVIENFKRSKGYNKKNYLHMITSQTADRHRNTCTVAFIT